MKIINCDQKSSKWFAARCGIPTGSGLSNIVTPTGKAVKGYKRDTYMHELLWERLTGKTYDRCETYAMRRGNELEPQAKQYYEMMHNCKVVNVGFCLHDDGFCGVSPDGFVEEDKGLEIKTAMPANYIKRLIAGVIPPEHVIQIQACLWVCEYETWDYLLYDDELPCMELVACRDSVIIDALAKHVPEFVNELNALEIGIRKRHSLPNRTPIDLADVSGDWRPF